MISDEKRQKALTYQANTDEPAAAARDNEKGLDQRRKNNKAVAFLEASGTMAE